MGRAWSWLVLVVVFGVMVAAVLGASERQRSTADTNFAEAQAANSLQVAMLRQENALDGYLDSGEPRYLRIVYDARRDLSNGLAEARDLSSDDETELRQIAAQSSSFAQWMRAADAAIRRRQLSGREDTRADELRRDGFVARFVAASNAYEQRLAVNRDEEQRAAALLPVWLLVALGGVLAASLTAVELYRRSRRKRRDQFAAAQARFVEAIQFAADEQETHELLARHLERTVPGSEVFVLNRNNSIDRLETAPPLEDGHPLAEALAVSEPRSCVAVRLSRRFDRDQDDAGEMLSCSICGSLDGPSSCQPLLVGGEVIGSVLLAHAHDLSDETDRRLHETVTQAAPVLANLRNLAIAQSRAATDALTGLPNRRSVDDTLRRMVAQADRTVCPLSIAVLDLDHFKLINDNYGHDRGDDVLAALAALLHQELRGSDFAGRSGGEEFVLFLPNTDSAGAVALAEKVRAGTQRLRVAGVDHPITASFGVATFPDDATTADGLLRVADRALYQAKRMGRDRVEVAGRPAGERNGAEADRPPARAPE
jgi:diguanylate cyclase (GGDEF)-like protein